MSNDRYNLQRITGREMAKGYHSSFEKVYEENYMKMYHIAFGILKHRMEAENAVQEAFVSIAQNYKRYGGINAGGMTALCITIVKHKCMDILRRQGHLSAENVEELVLYNENVEYEPELQLQHREQQKIIKTILEKLPETLYAVLVLKYYYDCSNHEIAKQLGLKVKTVEMRLYRAKKKMRELLEHEGYEGY